MSDTKHTPTPWICGDKYEEHCGITICSDDRIIAVISQDFTPDDEDEDNAEFICLACNCHDELMATMKELVPLATGTVDYILNNDGRDDVELATKVSNTLRRADAILAKVKAAP